MKRFILTIALLGSVLVSASNASNEFVLPLENKVVLESIVLEEAPVRAWSVPVDTPLGFIYFNTYACAYAFCVANNIDPNLIVYVSIDESLVIICL